MWTKDSEMFLVDVVVLPETDSTCEQYNIWEYLEWLKSQKCSFLNYL